MRISISHAIESALGHSKSILFDSFSLRKWLGLSFCLYLNFLWLWWPDYGQRADGTFPDYTEWIPQHPVAFAIILIASVLLLTLSAWLQSRAKFMFLDNVLCNSGAVKEPWRSMRHLGNSLFPLQFLLLLFASLVSLAAYFMFLLPGLGDLSSANPTPGNVSGALVPFYLLMFVLWSGLWLVYIVIGDFMVPIMYRRNIGAGGAFGLFASLLLPRFGLLLRYVGMKFLLTCAAGVLMMIGVCISACVVALPLGLASLALADTPWLVYLVTLPVNLIYAAMFLPVFVLLRLYPIYTLEQFGSDWWFFEREGAAEGVTEDAGEEPPDGGEPAVFPEEPPGGRIA